MLSTYWRWSSESTAPAICELSQVNNYRRCWTPVIDGGHTLSLIYSLEVMLDTSRFLLHVRSIGIFQSTSALLDYFSFPSQPRYHRSGGRRASRSDNFMSTSWTWTSEASMCERGYRGMLGLHLFFIEGIYFTSVTYLAMPDTAWASTKSALLILQKLTIATWPCRTVVSNRGIS